jgi:AraC family transcriptional regulator
MQPRIEILSEKKLVGKSMKMSFANNRTAELWRSFLLRKKEITNSKNNEMISMQVYDPSFFQKFNPANEFEKWATVEVADYDNIPSEMETYTLGEGLYAVFLYKGSSKDSGIFEYIYRVWLPQSEYLLDDKPHFEILGEKYKNEDPNSEEEIWIPIKPRNSLTERK